MFGKRLLWAVLILTMGAAVGLGVWLLSLPPAPALPKAELLSQQEVEATLKALQPPKRARPLIAVLGINDSTETTDYLVSYGALKRANVAEVVALGTSSGPMRLFPALTVQPQATLAQFDGQHPQGADYVIVPAMSRDDDPTAQAWIKAQAAKGAIIIGVCAGAKVVAEAGLLDGRKATTHWYYLAGMLKRHPEIAYVADRRWVVDGNVATTTGITASLPSMVALIEAVAGREKAQEVATGLGLPYWDARHASEAFRFNRSFAMAVMRNVLAFWRREEIAIELKPGMDEVSLALVADAWSRTYRSRAITYFPGSGGVATRSGLQIIPDREQAPRTRAYRLESQGAARPQQRLDATLREIAGRYGTHTANVVAMQLEYPVRFE